MTAVLSNDRRTSLVSFRGGMLSSPSSRATGVSSLEEGALFKRFPHSLFSRKAWISRMFSRVTVHPFSLLGRMVNGGDSPPQRKKDHPPGRRTTPSFFSFCRDGDGRSLGDGRWAPSPGVLDGPLPQISDRVALFRTLTAGLRFCCRD